MTIKKAVNYKLALRARHLPSVSVEIEPATAVDLQQSLREFRVE